MATYSLNRIQDPSGNIYMINGTSNQYGTCSTGASTAAKTVTINNSGFVLEAGVRVSVKFSSANTASNPTLNVNSKGAKNIFHKGSRITTGGNKALLAGIVDFIYDGTQWHLVGNYIDTTGADGDAKTSSSNSASKLYLVGATSQSTSGQTTYSNSSVYATNGTLNASKFEAGSADIQSINCQDISAQSVTCSYLEISGEDIFDIIDQRAGGSSTDTKVTQNYSTADGSYPLLMTATAGTTSTSSRGATTSILSNTIYARPSTGTLTVTKLNAIDEIQILSDSGNTINHPLYNGNDIDTTFYSEGIQWYNNDTDDIFRYYYPDRTGILTVSSDNTVRNFQVVTSLPSSPNANTIYFIK